MNKSTSIISGSAITVEMDEVAESFVDVEQREWVVDASGHGQRLDRVVAANVTEFSRSYLQRLIESGAVRCNGAVITKAAYKPKVSDVLSVELRPTPQSQAFIPQNIPIDVVYEDEHLFVINKPVGLVVHPAPGHWTGTLLNGLLALDSASAQLPRAGIVHRLDKDTSGLMVVARTRLAMDRLVDLIAQRQVTRQYLALAHHPWRGALTCTVDAPIGRDPRDRLRMGVVDLQLHAGKVARTDIHCLASQALGCLVRCHLYTGRTHQIRVHMAHLGHPLVGDALYGGKTHRQIQRQALHAALLEFNHPVTQRKMCFQSVPPADFLGLLQDWGFSYNSVTQTQIK